MNISQRSNSHHSLQANFQPHESMQDAYKTQSDLPEPSVCPQCSAIYQQGHWLWGKTPAGAHAATCPACRRKKDHSPAGFLTLRGGFLWEHRGEVMDLVNQVEKRERAEHPLKCIMSIEEMENAILVTTTDIALAKAIAESIQSVYKGSLRQHFNADQKLLRIEWMH